MDTKRTSLSCSTVAVTLVGAAAFVACSNSGTSANQTNIFEHLRARSDSVSRAPNGLYRTVREAMPDIEYDLDGRDLRASELFVAGTIASVEAARSFRWEFLDDVEQRIEVGNDDPSRQVTTYHFVVAVDGFTAAPTVEAPTKQIVVGLAVSSGRGTPTAEVESLVGLRVALVLIHSSVFDYDPGVWGVLQDGEFLGVVSPEGRITYPALMPDDPLLSDSALTVTKLFGEPERRIIRVVAGDTPGAFIRID